MEDETRLPTPFVGERKSVIDPLASRFLDSEKNS